MLISQLHIHNFRNIGELKFEFNPCCNLFYGANGSGKSSALEALYYLSTARSFRSHLTARVIKYDQDKFVLFALTEENNSCKHNGEDNTNTVKTQVPIGIERPLQGAAKIQMNGVDASVAELARLLPMQLLHQDSFELLTAGPKYRRKFIDWGMFHVEHNFLSAWKNAKRALEQRNVILRAGHQGEGRETLGAWSKELAEWGMALHKWRTQYIDELLPIINNLVARFLGNYTIKINYYAGWNLERDLHELLRDNAVIARDQELGFTQFGPHRADLRLLSNNIPLQDCLSRGQQKIFIFAIHLAQGLLLHKLTGKSCIYLIDDLAAELDKARQNMVADVLHEIGAQVFATMLAEMEDLGYAASERLEVNPRLEK